MSVEVEEQTLSEFSFESQERFLCWNPFPKIGRKWQKRKIRREFFPKKNENLEK